MLLLFSILTLNKESKQEGGGERRKVRKLLRVKFSNLQVSQKMIIGQTFLDNCSKLAKVSLTYRS